MISSWFAKIIAALTALALAALIVYPFAWLVIKSLESSTGAFPFWQNYSIVFSNPRYLEAIWTSFQVALTVAILSVVIGVAMAWAVARTDMPWKGFVRFSALSAFITPPFLGAIAWILLAAPQAGALNKLIAHLPGLEASTLNIYSFGGLCFVMVLYAFPFTFMFTTSSLELMSSDVEDAGKVLGARTWQIARSITVPLALPAIAGTFVLIFVESLALLGSPLLLATPARMQLITTQILEFFQYPANIEYAAAYSIPLLLVTAGALLLQNRLLRRKTYATLTGKGATRALVPLGRWRFVALFGCLLVCTLSLFLPYGALLVASLSKAWGAPVGLRNLTFDNFSWVLFSYTSTQNAIFNSVWFSAASACLAMLIGFAAAYIHSRKLVPGSAALTYLAMSPAVIPGIVLAIGMLAAFSGAPFYLYGTPLILILAFAARFLPIAYISSNSAVRNVHPEFEDAARILGASNMRTITSVTAPLIGKGIAAGWLLVMLSGIRELSAAIFLFAASTKVMAVILIDLSEQGQFERLSALSIVMLLITFAVVAVGYALAGRQFVWQRQ